MANKMELIKNFKPYILIPTQTSVADALTALHKSGVPFAIVGDSNHPQTLLREENLSSLTNEASMPLSELLDRFPPLLVVDGEVAVLDIEDLKQFADLLQQTKAPGLVVYQDKQVIGVISRSDIEWALPLTAIIPTSPKRMYGDASVPARTFICHKCIPPTRSRPRQGDEIPTCPKDWLHGNMEREYL